MAIQPTIRPAGSCHIIRFQGSLVTQATAGVQTQNAEVTQGALLNVRVPVKFALADMTALTNLQKRLPPFIYDDTQPAGSSPHVNTGTSGPSVPILPVNGVPAGKTWAQNVKVRVVEASNPHATLITLVEELFPWVQIDGAAGSGAGLEQSTGVPVVAVNFHFSAAGITALGQTGVPIVVEIEVPDAVER